MAENFSESFHRNGSEPVAYDKIRRPVTRVGITLIGKHFHLSCLQRLGLGNFRMVTELGVKIGNQRGRRLIVNEPKRGNRTARARLNRYTGETERGAIVSGSGL